MRKRKIFIWIMIFALLVPTLSACKKQDAADISSTAMQIESGNAAESDKSAQTSGTAAGTSLPQAAGPNTETRTEIPAEKTPQTPASPEKQAAPKDENAAGNAGTVKTTAPLPEGETGPKAKNTSLSLPDGVPFKAICIGGAYCKGAEEYIPYSYAAFKGKEKSLPSGAEEYVYQFDGSQIKGLDWKEDEGVDKYDSRTSCANYSKFIKAFGEDGYIVIGRASGKREGHLAYFLETPLAPIGIADGFTLTDFTVDEVLYGGKLKKNIRIKEDYLFGNAKDRGNVLYSTSIGFFALSDGCRFLLFLKKTNNQDSYEIFGGYGGLPLTEDYKNYDQEYLDHLAGYLNLIPEDCSKELAEALTNEVDRYYDIFNRVDQTSRSFQEALEANKDDLIVALAQKYKIKIWPYMSRGFEDGGLPFTAMASMGGKPDYKTRE